MDMILTGRPVDATEALTMGLANRVVPAGDLMAEAGKLVAEFPPEKVASITGIDSSRIRLLAREFASSESAVCYGRIGVSTQEFGGVCQWLINVLNIVTGNFDRAGGAMFTLPAFDPTFVILAMFASVEAIFLSTFVLVTQNRMQREADRPRGAVRRLPGAPLRGQGGNPRAGRWRGRRDAPGRSCGAGRRLRSPGRS